MFSNCCKKLGFLFAILTKEKEQHANQFVDINLCTASETNAPNFSVLIATWVEYCRILFFLGKDVVSCRKKI